MTRKRLESYRSEKAEISELRCKLNNLKVEDYTGNFVSMDYRSGFPEPQSVVGTDIDAFWTRRERLQAEISRLEQRCREVEQWIENIPDSLTRRIFRMYFEDGKKQREIAVALYIDQSNIRRLSYYSEHLEVIVDFPVSYMLYYFQSNDSKRLKQTDFIFSRVGCRDRFMLNFKKSDE